MRPMPALYRLDRGRAIEETFEEWNREAGDARLPHGAESDEKGRTEGA